MPPTRRLSARNIKANYIRISQCRNPTLQDSQRAVVQIEGAMAIER